MVGTRKTRDRVRDEVAASVRNVKLPFDARDRIAIVGGGLRNVSGPDGPPPCQYHYNYAPRWLWQDNLFGHLYSRGHSRDVFPACPVRF